jgi:hypothetical protein
MPYKDKEKAKEAKRKYRENNPEKCREASRKSRENNVEYRLFHASEGNAKKEGREHYITIEDIIIPTHCPYLGVELTNILGQGRVDTNPSLDRINNSKGYIKGNIRVISWRANRLKNNLTEEELIKFATSVLQLHC